LPDAGPGSADGPGTGFGFAAAFAFFTAGLCERTA
jgi:hypothetical protein